MIATYSDYWQQTDKSMLKNISQLIKEIVR